MTIISELLLDKDGAPRHAPDVHDDALTWLLLGVLEGVDEDTIPKKAIELLGRFADRAGIDQGMSADQQRAAIDAYFARSPLPAALRVQLEQAMREAATVGKLDDAAAALLGVEPNKGVLQRKAPPPAGAVAAGPMARFQLKK